MKERITEFADYVMDFYGNGGLCDMGASRDCVLAATGLRIAYCRLSGLEFRGGPIDRRAVKDILINDFDYKWVD